MITAAAELGADDLVVEVGPGLGVLTEELAGSAKRVLAIEIDPQIASVLNKKFKLLPNITIINADVLEVDPFSLCRSEPPEIGFSYKVVANLPYFIATPVIRHFLEAGAKPQRMVVMVQQEVAQSIVATPGKMSLLSISVQIYGQPSLVDYVPARSFYPVPKVDSAIVRIDVYPQPAIEGDIDGFFRVVRAGFSAPRKQLRNALAQGLSIPPAYAADLLTGAGIAPQRRAETLSIEEWAELYRTSVGSDHLKQNP